MSLRIEHIEIPRGGPLREDFELEPKALNIIYGPNESGKTYVVETLISLLFRTGRKGVIDWVLRDWRLSGRVAVTGIGGDPISFIPDGSRLEDYWESLDSIPVDLSRLIVVKAGETSLSVDNDGVGRSLLKDYLSGVGMLDEVGSRISKTVLKSYLEEGELLGPAQGELKNRSQYWDDLTRINNLMEVVERDYGAGELQMLQTQKQLVEAELDLLDEARRHLAAEHTSSLRARRHDRDQLPSLDEIAEVQGEISKYRLRQDDLKRKEDELNTIEFDHEDLRWAEAALTAYGNCFEALNTESMKTSSNVWITVLSSVGAVVTGLLGWEFVAIVLLVIAGIAGYSLFISIKRVLEHVIDHERLEELVSGYKERFDEQLNDQATLQAKITALRVQEGHARNIEKEISDLQVSLRTMEESIKSSIEVWRGKEKEPKYWKGEVRAIKEEAAALDLEIDGLRERITSLGIDEDRLLFDDPGVAWDADRYRELEDALSDLDNCIQQETASLETIRTRVIQETGLDSISWEEQLAALRTHRDRFETDYQNTTAKILAGIAVSQALEEFKSQEDTRIRTGLVRDELIAPLTFFTGRYTGMRLDENAGLVMMTETHEEFPLSELSTGTKEQVHLALRLGFASIALGGETGFFILDDAFQHSDWKRRERIVEYIGKLTQIGWQVFYFTMDDHINGLLAALPEVEMASTELIN